MAASNSTAASDGRVGGVIAANTANADRTNGAPHLAPATGIATDKDNGADRLLQNNSGPVIT